MQCNVGKADKIVRIIIGLVIIILGLHFKSWWGAIGLVPLLTALIGWCPLYVPLGIKTCKTEAAAAPAAEPAPPPAAEPAPPPVEEPAPPQAEEAAQPPAEEETQPPAEEEPRPPAE